MTTRQPLNDRCPASFRRAVLHARLSLAKRDNARPLLQARDPALGELVLGRSDAADCRRYANAVPLERAAPHERGPADKNKTASDAAADLPLTGGRVVLRGAVSRCGRHAHEVRWIGDAPDEALLAGVLAERAIRQRSRGGGGY